MPDTAKPKRELAKLIPHKSYVKASPRDMTHYIAIFELPDGEHVAHGWSQDLPTARKHWDDYILNRRRALIPEEADQTKLISVREVAPHEIDEEVEKENNRVREKYPDRLHAGDLFAVPNHILEQRITPEDEPGTDEQVDLDRPINPQ
jgi:hypothetical protein